MFQAALEWTDGMITHSAAREGWEIKFEQHWRGIGRGSTVLTGVGEL
ncbi:MAG: hypothetical protein PWQ31_1637 [Eubacteriales bacterium]|nr:hypothetical protein [Eubacteriales bacterium]